VFPSVRAIAVGYARTCVLMTTGGVRCSGDNQHGPLGDGNMAFSPTPTLVVESCG
jgi:hypothetical protein